MFGRNEATDKALLKTVNQKLSRGGGSRVTATVQQGTVTITGNLQYSAQRSPLLKLVARVAGVRRVIDQLKVVPKVSYPTGNVAVRPAAARAVADPEVDEATVLDDAESEAPPSETPASS